MEDKHGTVLHGLGRHCRNRGQHDIKVAIWSRRIIWVIRVNQAPACRVFLSGKGARAPDPDRDQRMRTNRAVAARIEDRDSKTAQPGDRNSPGRTWTPARTGGRGSMHHGSRRSAPQSVLVSVPGNSLTSVPGFYSCCNSVCSTSSGVLSTS